VSGQYVNQATKLNMAGAADPYLKQAATSGGLSAAQPYIEQATGTSPADLAASYMNPYLKTAVQSMSDIAQRNIRQNLSPAAAAAAVGSGQFGSQRGAQVQGQITAQAQQDLNNQIAQMMSQGYGQALCAAGKQNALVANAGNTAGTLAQQQASLLGQLGQTSGTLTGQQMQNLINAGNIQGTLTQQKCFEQDGHRLPERLGDYTQRTNNYRHTYPDSCSAPYKELVGSFYAPREGSIGAPIPIGAKAPSNNDCMFGQA
jgi:hypothetical protein